MYIEPLSKRQAAYNVCTLNLRAISRTLRHVPSTTAIFSRMLSVTSFDRSRGRFLTLVFLDFNISLERQVAVRSSYNSFHENRINLPRCIFSFRSSLTTL